MTELVERLRIEDARYPGDTLYGAAAAEIERLTAQLAEARQAERAAVVAFTRQAAVHQEEYNHMDEACSLKALADAIEAGEHLA